MKIKKKIKKKLNKKKIIKKNLNKKILDFNKIKQKEKYIQLDNKMLEEHTSKEIMLQENPLDIDS